MNDDIRFKGIANLFGSKVLERFKQSHVLIAGVGGVGSWVVEALGRSGIGKITLVDMDEVCVSNVNRQIMALDSTVGKSKVDVLRDRLIDINPSGNIDAKFSFVTSNNVADLILSDLSYVVDATDSLKAKCAMAVACRDKKIPFITIGAAGGKTDPSQIEVADLNKVRNDKLLKRMKLELKRDHGFSTSLRSLKIPAVFSNQLAIYPDGEGGTCETNIKDSSVKLDCGAGLGSATFVTGTFGFFAAHRVLKDIGEVA